ncbi:MFS general substrate transporter [Cryphonectria parasitica EP155]|uniref:MFS general substrate transporter n=1 Tax=Cryphonectria parasitica (strain ATCC 38755 / EP155) TaxID=660469 RepID=A0A9P5CNH5_CRYP1|nr:MFS general substrate transporter [Cryphonectria parasitica EP155]KAF3763925.1 MFS general substrate transporter [Cryphonectria parasitica EP155]
MATEVIDVDVAYLSSSKFTKFFRGVLFQMILFGAISFVGPAMSDAISNLGGGGLSSPYLSNLANALNYASGCLVTLIGGPLINKLGIKWSCFIAAVTFPLTGSSYYVSAKYSVNWYLLFSTILGGFTSGFLYVGETTAMLSYPHQDDRGLYLGIWSAMRSSGSVIGGAINFATNYSSSSAGGIAWATYIIFVVFECTGVFWAFLLSPTRKVRRRDGTPVPSTGTVTWGEEFRALWMHAKRTKTWLVFIPAFYSFFYGGTMGTYLSLHFSVRARALSTLIVPIVTIIMVMIYGKLLDTKRWSQTNRAWMAFILWLVPQVACFIWIGIEYSKFGTAETALDYVLDGKRWAEAYVPYLIIFTTGYWTQLSLYWILGTFSTDVKSSARTGGLFRAFETAGQAVSYSINSMTGSDPRHPFYVNCAVLALAIPCMVMLIRLVPEAPAEIDVDAIEDPVKGENKAVE